MKVVVIGGGMSGWLTATYLKKNFPIDVSLIESKDVPKLPVGESIPPIVNFFLHELGINEQDMLSQIKGSYKLGLKFINWNGNNEEIILGSAYNFKDAHLLNPSDIRLDNLFDSNTKVSDVILELIKQGRLDSFGKYFVPVYHYADKNVGFDSMIDEFLVNYHGYSIHINAETAADYIQNKIGIPLGISHIYGKVTTIDLDGEIIKSLELDTGEKIEADLFVDCSGLSKILIKKMGIKDKLYEDHILDTAVVCQTDYEDRDKELQSCTDCIGAPGGWMFKIGLQERMGQGYIFSSRYTTDQEALEYFLSKTKNHRFQPKFIRWKPFRLERITKGNMIAIGMSSIFIEPMEANLLKMTVHTITRLGQSIRDFFKTGNLDLESVNTTFIETADRHAEFVLFMYAVSQRNDTEFWRYFNKLREDKKLMDLAYHRYTSPETIFRGLENTEILVPQDQHWLQFAVDFGNDISSWKTREIPEDILDAGEKYFKERFERLDQQSSTEINFSKYLDTKMSEYRND